MQTLTKIVIVMTIVLIATISIVWSRGGASWDALYDSLLGLAMGGGIVWAVRIIASHALKTEAMGFGDVTLMCMIGAFVGWQPALLVFAFAPFASMLVVVVLLVVGGEQKIAFGPYLCISATTILLGWNTIWNDWARHGVFALGGSFLLSTIGVCLLLMAIILFLWSQIKARRIHS